MVMSYLGVVVVEVVEVVLVDEEAPVVLVADELAAQGLQRTGCSASAAESAKYHKHTKLGTLLTRLFVCLL